MGDFKGIRAVTKEGLMYCSQFVAPLFDVASLFENGTASNSYLADVIMTQYSLNKGLKIFGDKGTSEVHEEMQQYTIEGY